MLYYLMMHVKFVMPLWGEHTCLNYGFSNQIGINDHIKITSYISLLFLLLSKCFFFFISLFPSITMLWHLRMRTHTHTPTDVIQSECENNTLIYVFIMRLLVAGCKGDKNKINKRIQNESSSSVDDTK